MPASHRNHGSIQSDLTSAIGERIRRTRSEQNKTLRSLAAEVGVSPSTMSAIENGRTGVSAARLTEIATLLDVPVPALLPGGAFEGDPTKAAAGEISSERTSWRVFKPAPLDAPLQAALEAFMEVGYHGATMRDIAGRSGLSVPGVYHHYASKQDMLVTILNGSIDDLVWRYETAIAEASNTRDRFSNAVECMVLFHTRRRDWAFLGRTEQRSLEHGAAALTRDKRVAMEQSLIAIIDEGRDEGIFSAASAHVAGRAVIMMCVGTVYWYREDGPDSPEAIARQYLDLARRMVEDVDVLLPTATTTPPLS